ncbi:MAG: hypothetical protein HOP10_14425 [Chitinophagaceae bacterium]|nr:hypothetical protein [Chitinophagaceae bacterium]
MKRYIFLIAAAIICQVCSSQNVGIGITTPIARLHVSDSNVLFTGPVSLPFTTTYHPPASGAGSRMMWYPQKAAFRTGNVEGAQWDKDNIGKYSFATGFNTIAIGQGAFSSGYNSVASGESSTAMGYETTAGSYSTAMGFSTTAGSYSTAMGDGTIASGVGSTAMGVGATASGNNSTAMGYFSIASGLYSTAIGRETEAPGGTSTAMGLQTTASGFNSTAMGNGTTASGSNSAAMGVSTTASGSSSTTMGVFSIAKSSNSLVIGRYNDTTATNRLFEIGNGNANNARSNAMTVLENGNIGIGTTNPHALLQFANTAVNRKLILYETVNNDHQYYGFGINGGMLRYQVDDVSSEHTFFAATGAGTSQYVFAVHGDGNIFAPGIFTSTSDARLKKNITALGTTLDKIKELNGYTYNWISPTRDQRQQIGLLAQDVQKLFPQLVTEFKGDNDENVLGVNYLGLIPVLIEAIKEQQKQIEELKNIIYDKKNK